MSEGNKRAVGGYMDSLLKLLEFIKLVGMQRDDFM